MSTIARVLAFGLILAAPFAEAQEPLDPTMMLENPDPQVAAQSYTQAKHPGLRPNTCVILTQFASGELIPQIVEQDCESVPLPNYHVAAPSTPPVDGIDPDASRPVPTFRRFQP